MTVSYPQKVVFKRLPATDEELWFTVWALWGYRIPRQRVCPNHVAPFDALANAYFARDPMAMWIGSRGLAGKSRTLAALGLTVAALKGCEVTILGGSFAQSMNVHEATKEAWDWHSSPRHLLVKPPTRYDTVMKHGGHLRTLTASQTSVRGPHPPVLLCVAGDTLVDTPVGRIRIDELHPGRIVSVSRDMATPSWGVVRTVHDQGIKETVLVRFSDGVTVRCTPDHRFATGRGWVEARHLTPEDVFVLRDGGLGSPVLAYRPDAHVVEVVAAEPVRTWDITTDTGNFYANGVLVHNCDEIDEMDQAVLDAALGQPMEQMNYLGEKVPTAVVLSSTHQHPDKVVTEMLRRSKEQGFPVRHWCFKETSNPIDGWLTEAAIERARSVVSELMWQTEYCIPEGEPVVTMNGPVAVERLKIGQLVWTRLGWREVTNVFPTGQREVYQIVTQDGRTYRATGEHGVASPGYWARTDSLVAGDPLLVTDPPHVLPFAGTTDAVALGVDSGLSGAVMPVDAGVTGAVQVPIPGIVGATHQFQMIGFAATGVPADVVDRHSLGNGTDEGDVAGPVRLVGSNKMADAVSVLGARSRPLPAPGGVVDQCSGSDMSLHVLDPGEGTPGVGAFQTSGDPRSGDLGAAIHTEVVHVESVLAAGTMNTWDITVADAHEFTVNGIVLHNCLQEPSFGNRAINTDAVDRAFDKDLGEYQKGQPVPKQPKVDGRHYITAVDWAKSRDQTVIVTFDTTDLPWQCVAWQSISQLPWPVLVKRAVDQWRTYGGKLVHDQTGVGAAAGDLIQEMVTTSEFAHVSGIIMGGGRERDSFYTEYVSAIEHDDIRYPRIHEAWDEHRYCIARDVPVLTARGYVPIQDVRPGELVATREGWRRVTAARSNGIKPVLRIGTDFGEVTLTGDHLVATGDSWTRADALTVGSLVVGVADTAPSRLPVVADDGVAGSELVSPPAMGLGSLLGQGAVTAKDVLPVSDRFQVVGVATGSIAAQVVDGQTCGDGTDHDLVDHTVGHGIVSAPVSLSVAESIPLPAVAVEGTPLDDVSLVPGDGTPKRVVAGDAADSPACSERGPAIDAGREASVAELGSDGAERLAADFAFRLHAVKRIQPCDNAEVFDLTVSGTPEFVAGGIVVHNCTPEMLYTSKAHAPDSVVAGALAWHKRRKHVTMVKASGGTRSASPWI